MATVRAFFDRRLRRLRRLLTPALRRSDALASADLATGLEVLYRLLLARDVDEAGRFHYLRLMREKQMTLREVAAEIAASDEFQDRLRRRVVGPKAGIAPELLRPPGFVEVANLLKTLDLSELIRGADDYYKKTVTSADRYNARPLADIHEAPDMLGSFAHLMAGLRIAPGLQVLDFGAGTCWTTRFLAQLGCEVTALDVSATALAIGRDLFRRLPPIGETPEPHFLLFDGRRIDLPAASIDRVVCFDALHHVPNPAEVMAELARILRPGGIAGFSEPGPQQSASAKAQFEMKNFNVIENDIVMTDIWKWASAAGFTDLELAIFSTESCRVSLRDFNDLLAGGPPLDTYGDLLRGFLSGHQIFFLSKGKVVVDSRQREGLKGEIEVTLDRALVRPDESVRGRATIRNTGTAVWLPGTAKIGGVNVGIHLRTRDGKPLDVDFERVPLESGAEPGAVQIVAFTLAPPPRGEYLLEFDLVSEGVGWFEVNGSTTAIVPVAVGDAPN